eukprot:3006551-Rhodomonas_salina.2
MAELCACGRVASRMRPHTLHHFHPTYLNPPSPLSLRVAPPARSSPPALSRRTACQPRQHHSLNPHISTYHYLMPLNTLPARSYKHLAQSPVLPWVLGE